MLKIQDRTKERKDILVYRYAVIHQYNVHTKIYQHIFVLSSIEIVSVCTFLLFVLFMNRRKHLKRVK